MSFCPTETPWVFRSPKKNLARLMPGEEISQLNFFIYDQEQGRQAACGRWKAIL
jgi:hypothetical protein